jgi:hypothetical protein
MTIETVEETSFADNSVLSDNYVKKRRRDRDREAEK